MLKYCEAYRTMRESLCREQSREGYGRDGEMYRQGAVVINQNKRLCDGGSLQLQPRSNARRVSKDEILKNPIEDVEGSSLGRQFRRQSLSFEEEFTFTPRLNEASVRMVKERCGRAHEAVERRTIAQLTAETEQNFTFKPKVSSKSEKIVQGLKTSFFERQLIHVEKQKKMHLTNFEVNEMYCNFCKYNVQLDSQETMPSTQLPQQRLNPVVRNPRQRKQLNLKLSRSEKFQASSKASNEIEKNASTRSAPDCHIGYKKQRVYEKGDTKKCRTNDQVDTTEKEQTGLNVSEIESSVKTLAEKSPYNTTLKQRHKRLKTHPGANNNNKEASLGDVTGGKDEAKAVGHKRGSTIAAGACLKEQYHNIPIFHRLRQSKEMAETAIKDHKVFVCHGPYPIVRASLRKRGWIEKHFKGCPAAAANRNKQSSHEKQQYPSEDIATEETMKKSSNPESDRTTNKKEMKLYNVQNEQDNYDSSDEDTKWNAGYEGEDCEYSLLSRFCRNATASFFWTCKRDDIDFKFLRKDQTANHFSRAYSFTTKVGLSTHLRNLSWFENAHSDTFFPRCHRLGSDEERQDFIDDYHVTTACNILKCFIKQSRDSSKTAIPDIAKAKSTSSVKTDSFSTPIHSPSSSDDRHQPKSQRSRSSLAVGEDSSVVGQVPSRVVTLAVRACEEFMMRRKNEDIDEVHEATYLTEENWQELIGHFYELIHNNRRIEGGQDSVGKCQEILNEIRPYLPQLDLDGDRNVWIVKPGAKSRGRGIMCMDQLQDILKLVSSTVKKENRWIVQKYIECPLLIYNTKFDIRQWFLVTDWNPLTLWFYKDCYFRFCSREFTLDNFEPCIHLANNSIQKHYQNGVRDERLPDNNMWSRDDFREYLSEKGRGHLWEEVIYPGMKQAIVYTLECCQITLDARKNSFELYGADFMLSSDYKPWLIEINSSPAMAASTLITRKLCANVIEDTMKVVLDRREDKLCDTGRFELAFKQPFVDAPPYIGMNLTVSGKSILPYSGLHWRRQPSIDRLEKLPKPKEQTDSKAIKSPKELSENTSDDGEGRKTDVVVLKMKEKSLTLNCSEGKSNGDVFPAKSTKQARSLGNGVNIGCPRRWKSVELLDDEKKQDGRAKNTQLQKLNITSDIKYRYRQKTVEKNSFVKPTNRFKSTKKQTTDADSKLQPRIITIPNVGVPRTMLRYTDNRFKPTKTMPIDIGSGAKLRKEPEGVK